MQLQTDVREALEEARVVPRSGRLHVDPVVLEERAAHTEYCAH